MSADGCGAEVSGGGGGTALSPVYTLGVLWVLYTHVGLCHVVKMECRGVVRVPVCLGHTGAELREMNPGLSDLEIEGIMNASYELVATYDLDSGEYVSVETVTRYRD